MLCRKEIQFLTVLAEARVFTLYGVPETKPKTVSDDQWLIPQPHSLNKQDQDCVLEGHIALTHIWAGTVRNITGSSCVFPEQASISQKARYYKHHMLVIAFIGFRSKTKQQLAPQHVGVVQLPLNPFLLNKLVSPTLMQVAITML